MSVTITWSATNGGSSLTTWGFDPQAAGSTLTAKELFIEHNGLNPLTSCSFYLAGTDATEVIGWGDETTSANFGGVQLNMRAITSPSYNNWPTYSDKSPSGMDTHTYRTGYGDTTNTGIVLASNTGAVNNGILQAGSAPNVRFQLRVVLPSTAGAASKSVTQKFKFTFTS